MWVVTSRLRTPYSKTITFTSNTFDNVKSSKGAIYMNGESNVITLKSCNFLGTISTGRGGAFYETNSASLKIDNCSFYETKTGDNGGAIYCETLSLECTKSEFIRNNYAATGIYGGAICYSRTSGKISITHCKFEGSIANDGAAIYARSECQTTFTNITFMNFLRGDNIVSIGTSSTNINKLEKCKFINTYYKADSGCGAWFYLGTKDYFIDCVFENCTAGEYGGCYKVIRNTEFSNCDFNNCHSGYSKGICGGGAIEIIQGVSECSITNCKFNNCSTNSSVSSTGGGAIHSYCTTINVESCMFQNCYSSLGGAIFFFDLASTITLQNLYFDSCSSISGGGLYCPKLAVITIQNNTFCKCEATNSGGAIFASETTITFSNDASIFDGNKASKGGGLYLNEAIISGNDLIFEKNNNNTATIEGGFIWYKLSDGENLLSFSFSNLKRTNCPSEKGSFLYLDGFDSLTLNNIEFDNNPESVYGINFHGKFEINFCNFNKFDGSAISIDSQDIALNYVTFHNMKSTTKNCINLLSNIHLDTVKISNSIFSSIEYGIIHASSSIATFDNTTFSNCINKNENGMIYLKSISNSEYIIVLFENCIFKQFSQDSNQGHSINIERTSNLTVNRCDFEDISSNSNGGAISSTGSINEITIQKCKFK
ncbi:hypothetical protein TRFO_17035 [Tritrichomonas foetus]|uniref:Right handed beta helix domain-containing protein n=1 Tax=Tritrichomonas foetus TaxID=1144522 RepID=A0A1J4KTT5_9EUKA|nr:hypothetical protein TRFO_17035 [Tritrichomonas foetus]|eukprot:OHT12893.1 hypothetical protein TRFO_17035 [Tritrichomonas foetus]